MLDPSMASFVRESLPRPPARLLEIGAGDGALARTLRAEGYDVVAIDPASDDPDVVPVPLNELHEPPASFAAAVAVLSLHHVEPLHESCRLLAHMVRSGGILVLDEIDFERFDERAAGWWLEHHEAEGEHARSPAELVAHLRQHCHILSTLQGVLAEWFELTAPVRGPYLYRWELSPSLRYTELDLIRRGTLPATGARLLGIRR
jgi:2-polyprenyl-3-methyl-5-hydroxy-6-metoxy-1,4-benzoquinol methylase